MADKRKDSRGIVLQQGESQNAAGRYRYRYFDDMGLPHDVYSWRLRPEDPVPEGKKPGASLRELEKEIQKDRLDGVKTWEDITVNKLMQEYIEQQKPYWRANTLNSKMDTYKNHIKDTFGRKKVSKVTPDSVENFYNELLNRRERPIKMGTLELVNTLLNATFKLAVKRNLIRNNPVTGCLGIVKKKNRIENSKKHALEEKQQRALLEFMRDSPKYMQYYPFFYILAWTGCRIGDADGKISLNQQKPSKHAGLRRFGPEKFLQRNNEFMKERPIFYKKPIKTEKDFSTWLRCFYYTTKAVITEYIYF